MKQIFKNNKGSTLLIVIISLCFVVILGSLILSLTMTNIQMKQIDYKSKNNFYGTETVMDELKTGLETISSDCMYKAYNYLMVHYSEITQNPNKKLKTEFDTQYIKELVKALCGSDVTYNESAGTTYYYKPAVLKNCLISVPESEKNNIILYGDTELSTNKVEVNLDKASVDTINYVTLKEVKIRYTDSQGYETSIVNDINLEAPNLNFDSASIYPEFTTYSIIADNALIARDGKGMSIDGNLYVGAGGLKVDATNVTTPDISDATSGYNIKITGNQLVTRGNITVNNFAKLFIGDITNNKSVNVWAENIETTGNSSGTESSYININGNCKIADDLTLGAKKSDVIISGTYDGYSYNKTNTDVLDGDIKTKVNSNYSSAILINGFNSTLDMSGLRSLSLAGRAFISRKNQDKATVADDIMLGESISVKSNQVAYLIPNQYIISGHNPVTQAEIDALPPGKGMVDLTGASFLNLLTDKGYVDYHYLMGGTMKMVCYYLEFKNQASANTYFKNYYNVQENKDILDTNADAYLTRDGITLSGSLLLSAYAMKTNSDGTLGLTDGVISNPDSPDTSLLNDAIRTAKEYKSRQLGLINGLSSEDADFRLDKTKSPLFKTVMSQDNNGTPSNTSDDRSLIEKETESDSVATANGFIKYNGNYYKMISIDTTGDGHNDYSVYIIRNLSDIDTKDIMDATSSSILQNGIIITTGNLTLKNNFEGLIISGGNIVMTGEGLSLKSNTSMVREILSYALDRESKSVSKGGWYGDNTKKFTHYFTDYSNAAAGNGQYIDDVDISDYITYDNWKKNVD